MTPAAETWQSFPQDGSACGKVREAVDRAACGVMTGEKISGGPVPSAAVLRQRERIGAIGMTESWHVRERC